MVDIPHQPLLPHPDDPEQPPFGHRRHSHLSGEELRFAGLCTRLAYYVWPQCSYSLSEMCLHHSFSNSRRITGCNPGNGALYVLFCSNLLYLNLSALHIRLQHASAVISTTLRQRFYWLVLRDIDQLQGKKRVWGLRRNLSNDLYSIY